MWSRAWRRACPPSTGREEAERFSYRASRVVESVADLVDELV
jgi:hypothetical protein